MTDILIAALAGHRAGRYVAIDALSASHVENRERLMLWATHEGLPDWQVKIRLFFYDMWTCPHCVGFWLTCIASLALATRWRWLRFLVGCWAAAGVQSTLASFQMANDVQADLAEAQTQIAEAEMELAREADTDNSLPD